MKKYILMLIAALLSITSYCTDTKNYKKIDFFESIKQNDKAAILVVHFGTSHSDTRSLTIDVLNSKIKEYYPNIEVRDAYTSQIIIKKLLTNNIKKQNTNEALEKLYDEGYTHILVQPTTIINGVEMEAIHKDADKFKTYFKDLRISNPLLYHPLDYEYLIETLTKNTDSNKAYVLVGHGTEHSSTAQYTMLDYMLKIKGHKNFFVGTIEGYPEIDEVITQLKKTKYKNIELIPLMFVAGEHAKNDVAVDWKNSLEKEGYTVNITMKGLGENIDIQNLYLKHLQFITQYKKICILEKKEIYKHNNENNK